MSTLSPTFDAIDARGWSFGIVAARYNQRLVDALLARCASAIEGAGAACEVVRVPGSNEIPVAVQALAAAGRHEAFVALGLLVRGDTIHYEVIGHAVTRSLLDVALAIRRPVINGVLTVETLAQAEERCGGGYDRGREFAGAALEMAALFRNLRALS
jgi:6,7-dimethyl-8-ribityllumazine synthase